MLAGDGLTHLFQQVRGEDEVGEAFVGRPHNVCRHALPFLMPFVDEDDVLTDTHDGVHVVGIDDGGHLEFLGNGMQQIINNQRCLRV